MDAMVSARVPVEIKRQGDRKLKELGSSATELINAAYRYVLDFGELPGEQALRPSAALQVKTLSGQRAREFARQWRGREVLDAEFYDGHNFKELLDESKDKRYARLS